MYVMGRHPPLREKNAKVLGRTPPARGSTNEARSERTQNTAGRNCITLLLRYVITKIFNYRSRDRFGYIPVVQNNLERRDVQKYFNLVDLVRYFNLARTDMLV